MRLATIAAFAALGLALPAQASSIDSVTVKVSYRDLNIASESGLATLKKRVRVAIRRACASMTSRTLADARADSECNRLTAELAAREIERHRQQNFALLTQPAG